MEPKREDKQRCRSLCQEEEEKGERQRASALDPVFGPCYIPALKFHKLPVTTSSLGGLGNLPSREHSMNHFNQDTEVSTVRRLFSKARTLNQILTIHQRNPNDERTGRQNSPNHQGSQGRHPKTWQELRKAQVLSSLGKCGIPVYLLYFLIVLGGSKT